MNKYYRDYFWKEGIPRGVDALQHPVGESYKIVMDPYRKRISIEKYSGTIFTSIIYDSALVNFRHLKPEEQASWQKELIKETPNEATCVIRNQDDRVIFLETYFFEDNQCRECHIFAPQGPLIGVQKIQRVAYGNAFDGVILWDSNDHQVMYKKYSLENGEFASVLEESWDMETIKKG